MRVCERHLSCMDLAILRAVEDHPYNGLDLLAIEVEAGRRSYVGTRVRRLHRLGLLEVEFPRVACRGHKIVIMKGKRR